VSDTGRAGDGVIGTIAARLASMTGSRSPEAVIVSAVIAVSASAGVPDAAGGTTTGT
jgi:hypothetical protein